MNTSRRQFLLNSGSAVAAGALGVRYSRQSRAQQGSATPAVDTNGKFTELWLNKLPSGDGVAMAAYSTSDGRQELFVASSDGAVRPLVLGPPNWHWQWQDPIAQHVGIAGLTAYSHPGDGGHHCFIIDKAAAVWDVAFSSLADRSSLKETWVGGYPGGATPIGIAGFSGSAGKQHLFVAGQDGRVLPLEIGPSTNWAWSWGSAISSRMTGL